MPINADYINIMANKSDTQNENNVLHKSIVQHELDAAVISLKKRLDSLKGVDVSFPKKPNPFSNGPSKSK